MREEHTGEREYYIKLAIKLAMKGLGYTSPNPCVGAILVKDGKIIGRGYHRKAGMPHAEIDAINDAKKNGYSPSGSTLYVTLEPCSTYGKTPPCTEAIIREGIKEVVAGCVDPNPHHSGRGFEILKKAGVKIVYNVLADRCAELNEGFNHWIVHNRPFVTVKCAMTLDGRIATASGQSKWITSERARQYAMRMRRQADAILVGVNTIIADDPSLTYRSLTDKRCTEKRLLRIILDSKARTPIQSKVISDGQCANTIIFTTTDAPADRVKLLEKRVRVIFAEKKNGCIDLNWVLKKLSEENVLNLLVEGGGRVATSFLEERLAHKILFFYAPKIICDKGAIIGIGGNGARNRMEIIELRNVQYKRISNDILIKGYL